MAQPILLACNISPASAATLAALCERLGMRYRPVTALEYAVPIGALAGIPVAKHSGEAPALTFSEPMLVMCHLLAPDLDAFLSELRNSGLPPIPLKAVLTPTNVTWSARQLRDELTREHEAMQMKRRSQS